jgi:roadblock/LC7 domain-containing protein
MKNILTHASILFGCILATIAPKAFANHRSGDFALPEIVRAGDFDGDGKLDLLVNVSGFDHIAMFQGDGQGNFTLKRQFETDTLPKGLAVGDIDNDGRLDFVTIHEWGYNTKVNLGDGAGGFTFAQELKGDGEATRVYLADLNNDGNLDVIGNAPQEGAVAFFFSKGHGHFNVHPVELEDLPNCQSVAAGDFNQDGNPDVAVAYYEDHSATGSHIVIFLGDGNGTFTELTRFGINPEATNVVPADVNGDGKVDLLVSGAGAENDAGIFFSVYLGSGDGFFTPKQVTDLGLGSMKGEIAIGDFNEDGKLDIALPISSLQTQAMANTKSTSVFIYLGDGTGAFTKGQTARVGQEPHTAVAKDFNGDGHIDLVVSNRSDATISVLFGAGDGTFTTHATIPVNSLPEGAGATK